MTSTWIFTQLGGKKAQLRLEGHAAPHGRPRKGELVAPGIEIRESEHYYWGNPEPSRQIGGLALAPYELRGIFSDRYGGKGFALAKHNEVQRFVAGMQQVSIVWGDVISARGLIKRYAPRVEGRSEIPWEMTILIDRDLTIEETHQPIQNPIRPSKRMQSILIAMAILGDMGKPLPPTMKGSIFDSVASFIYAINSATASLVAVVDQVGNIATAPFHLLRTLRAGIESVRTAVTRLRSYYDDLTTLAALETQEAQHAAELFDLQAAWGQSSLEALRELAEMEREAVLSQRGRTVAYYAATDGDTWESISTAYYGSPDRAGDIQEANGIEAGTPPIPGEAYLIPV